MTNEPGRPSTDPRPIADPPPPIERIASAQRMLGFLGIQNIVVDMTELIGQINAIGELLVQHGLVDEDRLQELALEHRADFLEGLIKNAQTVAQSRSNVGPTSAKEKQP